MKGNALKFNNYQELNQARNLLLSIKETKLRLRAIKYADSSADLEDFIEHLSGEVEELIHAYDQGDIAEIIKETADISNCCDLITLELMDEYDRSIEKLKGGNIYQ